MLRVMEQMAVLLLGVILLVGCQQERTGGPLMAGDSVPDFMAKDIDGNVIVLSNFKEQPVVIRFFETDCRFCKADTPVFSKFFNEYQDAGLKVIYIGSFYENIESVRSFVELLEVPFPVLLDEGARLADLYNVKVYPQTFMVGPDRQILATLFGGVGEAEFQEVLGEYLQ